MPQKHKVFTKGSVHFQLFVFSLRISDLVANLILSNFLLNFKQSLILPEKTKNACQLSPVF